LNVPVFQPIPVTPEKDRAPQGALQAYADHVARALHNEVGDPQPIETEPPRETKPKVSKLKDVKSKSGLPKPRWGDKPNPWTERATELLTNYRKDGRSFAVIAKSLTAILGIQFTSSMCSAKADRLKLPRIPVPGGRPPKKVEPLKED